MAKKRVYVESSVISWLVANPPNDFLKLAKQRQTQIWWEQRRKRELFISSVVVREIRRGDPAAARKRALAIDDLPLLPEPIEAGRLAAHLVAAGIFPEKAVEDATHVAIAAVNGMDCLATWNQKHIFNPFNLENFYSAIRGAGYEPPVLIRPDLLLEEENGA